MYIAKATPRTYVQKTPLPIRFPFLSCSVDALVNSFGKFGTDAPDALVCLG